MINFIGIVVLLLIVAVMFHSTVAYYKHKLNISDNEIAERDRELGKRTSIIKEKNITIRLQETMIMELENENKKLKRECNKRLRKDSKVCN